MAISSPSLLAYALTGEDLPIRATDGSIEDFLSALEAAGWPPDRVRSFANDSWDHEAPWPRPLPAHSLDSVGAAQWYATLTSARAALGLDVVRFPPSRRTTLTSDEQRLLADLPPHYGSAG